MVSHYTRPAFGLTILVLLLAVAACTMPESLAPTTGAEDTERSVAADVEEGGEPEVVVEATSIPQEEQKEEAEAASTVAEVILVPTNTPAPTAIPEEEVVKEEVIDWRTTVTLEDDLYILGNPNAPVRLIDYSDFL